MKKYVQYEDYSTNTVLIHTKFVGIYDKLQICCFNFRVTQLLNIMGGGGTIHTVGANYNGWIKGQ